MRPERRYLFGQEQILDPARRLVNPDQAAAIDRTNRAARSFPPILPDDRRSTTDRHRVLACRAAVSARWNRSVTTRLRRISRLGKGPRLPGSEPNRWFIGFGQWQRYADPRTETPYQTGRLRFWHPYLQSKLKTRRYGQTFFST
jgi:hypothetical protein